MSLGDQFPQGMVESSVARQLLPGVVVKFRACMDDGKVHEKRFVILHVDEEAMTCVINSDINLIIRNDADRLRCQVEIQKSTHDFMDHDSHIDCGRVRAYPKAEVLAQLAKRPGWILGSITTETRDQMVSALKHAPTLSAPTIALCCESLEKSSF